MTNEEPTTKVVTSPNRRRNPAGEIGDTRLGSRLQSIEEHEYQIAMETPEVKAALLDYERAQATRDSISRKLSCGSTHVTLGDLANWEVSLSESKKALAQRWPILKRHPMFTAVVAHS